MSIEKKSLISTLKTTKKANVAKEEFGRVGTSGPAVSSPTKSKIGLATRGKVALATKGKVALATRGKAALPVVSKM